MLKALHFYYRISPYKLDRFVKAVDASDSIAMIREGDVTFITVNSMAFEGDHCNMCAQARHDLNTISERLNCAKVLSR